jgi:type I site-specific restriction-modification system R (restriction) subunit
VAYALRGHFSRILSLFWFNALLIASNGTDRRVGSLTADWERFFEVLPHRRGSEVVDATQGSR